jgi:hypothetical protein
MDESQLNKQSRGIRACLKHRSDKYTIKSMTTRQKSVNTKLVRYLKLSNLTKRNKYAKAAKIMAKKSLRFLFLKSGVGKMVKSS